MATYYIDPDLNSNGDGSENTPYNTLPVFSSNNTYLFKRGTKLTFQNLEVVIDCSSLTGLVFGAYGTGERPILSGETVGEWEWDSINNLWYSESFDTFRGPGCVTDNEQPLTWIKWNTNLETTIQSMVDGSFSLDHTISPKKLYVKPRTTINNILVASSWAAFYRQKNVLGSIEIQDLHLKYFSGNCINLGGVINNKITRCLIQFAGGFHNTVANFTGGAGIQIYDNSDTVEISYCEILDSFDSGITPQAFTDNGTIKNVKIYKNIIKRFALGGVEVATFNPGTILSNIQVFDNIIEDGGRGYSGFGDELSGGENEVVPAGLYADFSASTSSVDCLFYNNLVKNCYYGGSIRGSNNNTHVHWVKNKILDCSFGFRLRNRTFGSSYGMVANVVGNLVLNPLYDGVVMSVQYGDTNNTAIINNSFINVGRYGVNQTFSVGEWEFKNNIVQTQNSSTAILISGGSSPSSTKNCIFGFLEAYSGMTDPETDLLVSPELNIAFYPRVSSPLILEGDYNQKTASLTYWNPPSIGAYEYIRPRAAASTRTMRT